MSGVKRVDQGMAEAAAAILGDRVDEATRTRMRQLPQRLRGSGLAATYAFLLAKGAGSGDVAAAYRKLARGIAQRVAEEGLLPVDGSAQDLERQFLQRLTQADLTRYARVSAEVDALAVWLSRLAEALRPDSSGGGGRGQE